MIAGDHGCYPEWRRFSLAGRDLRIGQDGAKRMDFSESEVSQTESSYKVSLVRLEIFICFFK